MLANLVRRLYANLMTPLRSNLNFLASLILALIVACAGTPAVADQGNSSPAAAEDAISALRVKDYDRAIDLLRTAIALNPNDAGIDYDPTAFNPDEISDHGHTQLLKMVAERPLMGRFLVQSGTLARWT